MKLNLFSKVLAMSKFFFYLVCLQSAFATVAFAETGHAQSLEDAYVSCNWKNLRLEEAFANIQNQTAFFFTYDRKLVRDIFISNTNRKVALVDLLKYISSQTNLQFSIFKDVVYVLREGVNVEPTAAKIFIQVPEKEVLAELIAKPDYKVVYQVHGLTKTTDIIVRGRVTATTGEALVGATILVKETGQGTVTDNSGNFTVAVPEGGTATLIISYIGYQTREVSVNGRTQLDIQLALASAQLDEIIVVGYGNQSKKNISASIARLTEEEIKQNPVLGIDQILQGRVAGIQVTQTSGEPGGIVAVRIRGTSSITAGNEPLYVIDGVPFYNWNTTYNQSPAGILGGGGAIANALSTINPNDIESITVLKDAAAAAIYGSRAANGVIIITTKRGVAGKNIIEFDSYYGSQSLAKRIEVLNSREQAELVNEARLNGRSDLGNPNNPPLNLRPVPTFANPANIDVNTDWQRELFQNAPMQNYQLSASGGNEMTQYAITASYYNQEGILKVSGFKRYAGRINLDQKVSDRLKIGGQVNFNNSTKIVNRVYGVATAGALIYSALQQTPALAIYDVEGNYARLDVSASGRFVGMQQIDNPLSSALEYWNPFNTTRVIGNLYGEYSITPSLKLRSNLAIDANYVKNNIFIPIRKNSLDIDANGNRVSVPPPNPNTGNGFSFASQELTWLNENTLTYNFLVAKRHKISALAGVSLQGSGFERMVSRAQNFPNNLAITTNAGQTDLSNNFIEEWHFVSFVSRLNYTLNDKYLMMLAMRADGSSRFGPKRKFGYFPSFSVGWRISEEEFLKKSNLIEELKLRVSYGATGNSEIVNNANSFANFAYLGQILPANYAFGNTLNNGLALGSLSNEDLGWETTTQLNVGLDLGILQGRFNITLDFYNKETRDLLLRSYPLPATTGYTTVFRNIGTMRNRGMEFTLTSLNINRNFKWNTDLNVAYNENKVLSLGPNLSFLTAGNSITRPGESVGSFFGFMTDGIFQNQSEIDAAAIQNGNRANTKPGDIRFKDINSDGIINERDRVILGNPQPRWIFGLTNTFSLKGLELTLFLQGIEGNTVFNRTRQVIESFTGDSNASKNALNRWRSPDQPGDGKTPRATAIDPNNNRRFSDRWLEDGSFLRVKNLTIAYSIPEKFLKALRMQRLRIYATTQNLFTFTRYSGYDPEFNRQTGTLDPLNFGVDDSNYPIPRTILFGLNAQF